ncbi:MAG: LptF/LptG family permease [Bryobacteraceae bacterium]|nr:LptF/LptG family permease [Bryobacteraceae bacterium]
MRILSRAVFREAAASATLGFVLFTFVLFLQRSGQLFEFLIRNSAPPATVAYLFSLVFPQVLPFTLPLGVLVGILISLGRMSSDGEITAMRAAGVPGRIVLWPILVFAALTMLVTAACSLWLSPWSWRERIRVANEVLAAQLTADVQPRVFDERFPNRILYVGDVIPGPVSRWRNVFIADVTPPHQRPASAQQRGEEPRVTLASGAIVTADVEQDRVQLSLLNGSTYETGEDVANYTVSAFPKGEQLLEARKKGEMRVSRPSVQLDTLPLFERAYRDRTVTGPALLEARIELHQRLALPLACVLLALVGVPLGAASRKAGKSSALVLTIALAFLYYMGLISLIGLARQQTLPVAVAVWMPNLLFALAGLIMMLRLEHPGDRDLVGAFRTAILRAAAWVRGRVQGASSIAMIPARAFRVRLMPQVLDTYILSSFLYYFGVLLVSFVLMTHVFTFFELLSDVLKNHIPMAQVLRYHLFLTPKLIYDFTPISVLSAVLIVFGLMTKHNEVTAFKACGVSQYRLTLPILLASVLLSGTLFGFDHYVVPEANRVQDAIRDEIKGRPTQTYLRPDRKWILGDGNRVFYYKFLDPKQNEMLGVSVFDVDTRRFRLSRQISAEKARWEPGLKTWVFQNGWSRKLDNIDKQDFLDFRGGTTTFSDIRETPDYFVKEVKQGKQMNFQELDRYIRELKQSGFDTVALQVQYHKKFAVPLFALIMALISIPFAFVAGNRGAMTGVGMSIGIALSYWSISQLFEQVGNASQLPAPLAAWSPDVLFSLTGLYFLFRMRT